MKYVLITGGGLENKGAQAMTFITVCEVRKRYPDHEIILISYNDYRLSSAEKKRYKFGIETPPSMVYALYRLGGIFKALSILGRHTNEEQARLDELYGKADILIDVSGYALGSNWGVQYCLNYLNSILIAKAYKMRCFIMPQSFGPFNFTGVKGRFVGRMIKKLLRYPEVVYAREQEGYNLLTNKYGLKNVKLSCDLVLNNCSEVDLEDIYEELPNVLIPEINKGSVGIIPNMQNFRYGNRAELSKVYEELISWLIGKERHVYLFRHSVEDMTICHELKSRFPNDDCVTVLDGDYSCNEYNTFVGRFDFLIASRFHSIVHAFKNSVPCVVLGWAVKYHDLLGMFEQSQYIFDVRETLDSDQVLQAVTRMASFCERESAQIGIKLEALQKDNVYDVISPIG